MKKILVSLVTSLMFVFCFLPSLAEATEHSHNYTYSEIPATCTEPAYEVSYCEECTYTSQIPKGEPLGHDFVNDECSRCGVISVQDEIIETIEKCVAPTIKTANVSSTGKVKVSWEAVEGAVKYRVYRRAESETKYTAISLKENLSYTDSKAEVGVKYYYKVVAVAEDAAYNSDASNVRTGIRDCARPAITISNNKTTGKVKVSWGAVDSAVKYRVYRSTSKDGTYTAIKLTTSTSYTDTKAEVGKAYYYKVTAVAENTSANSASSTIKSGLCDCARPVVAISNVAKTGKIKLTWKAVDDAVKYRVYRSTSKSGTYTAVKLTTDKSFTDKDAVAGKTYYYKVTAVAENTKANSEPSVIKSAACDYARPVAKLEKKSALEIKLSWNNETKATGFIVYRSTSENGTYKKLKTLTSTAYTDKTVSAGKTYYYKVVATGKVEAANSAESTVVKVKAALKAPKLKTTVNATSSSIKIAWTKLEGADGYFVYKRSSVKDDWKKIATLKSGSKVEYTDKSAKGVTYYAVSAYQTVNEKNYAGDKATLKSRTLGKVTSVKCTPSETALKDKITWKTVSGATGYQVQYKTNTYNTWREAAAVGKVTSKSLSVKRSIYYTYRVKAIYEYDGFTTYGPASAETEKSVHFYIPDIGFAMSDETAKNVDALLIYIENYGSETITFFSEGAEWLDGDNYDYDRRVVLCNYNKFMNEGEVVAMDEIEIEPGEGKYLLVVAESLTRYTPKTQIYLDMLYDKVHFKTLFSYSYGFQYYVY